MNGRVLIIAGSDSGGGAGIQGDIKTITALGGYAMTAITALTAQDTRGVHGIHEVPLDFIEHQIRLCLDDIGADAIKTGMLHSVCVIDRVVEVLADYPDIPLIIDPVMRAKGGAALLQDAAQTAVRDQLIPRAHILCPNVPEAQVLTGHMIETPDDLIAAGRAICALGADFTLMKGGHLPGAAMADFLVSPDQITALAPGRARTDTRHTHGTGCALASATAAGIAQGLPPAQACERGVTYVAGAMAHAPGYGQGHGPLNHAWQFSP